MVFDTRAIRASEWDSVKNSLLSDGWQFRNHEYATKDELDNGSRFWSSIGGPQIISGVIYVRKPL